MKNAPYLEKADLVTGIHATVTLGLGNCNEHWSPLKISLEPPVDAECCGSANLKLELDKAYVLLPILQTLHCLPTHYWAQIKVLVVTYKVLHGPILFSFAQIKPLISPGQFCLI